MRKEVLVWATVAAAALWVAPAWAQERERAEGPPAAAALEGQVREVTARISQLEQELAALKQRDVPPADRIEAVTKQVEELRGRRERLMAQLRERGEGRAEPRREEGEARRDAPRAEGERRVEAERVEAQVRELNQVLERRNGHLRELIQQFGRENERVAAEEKEIRTLRERRDALLAQLKAPQGERREEPARDRPRAEGEARREEPARPGAPAMEPELRALRERDPEGFELQQRAARMEEESRRMGEAVRRAEGPQREELTRKLRGHLNELFDLRLKIRQREVERLERELKALTGRLEERRNAKERLVDQRLRQLTGEGEVWEW